MFLKSDGPRFHFWFYRGQYATDGIGNESLKILGEKEVGPGGCGAPPPAEPASELPSPPSTSQAALLLQLPHLPADADPSGEGIHGDTVPMLGREGAQQG